MSTEGIIGQRNTVPSRGFDQGEHGAGIGAAGGYDESNPKATPIADKYMGGADSYGALGTGRAPLDIDNDTAGTRQAPLGAAVAHSHGHGHSHGQGHGQTGISGSAVSGAYEGSGTRDGLTGEAHSHRVGDGAGYLGENFSQTGSTTSAALAGTAAGATAGAGLAATRLEGADGSIVGPAGGAGGHYTTSTSSSATQQGAGVGVGAGSTGKSNVIGDEYSKRSVAGGEYGHNPAVATTTAGNGPLGAGAAAGGLGAAGTAGAVGQTNSGGSASSGATTGHFGTVDDHNRGEPVSDPKELDTGGPHSLVYEESTGKYVHRHDLESSR